jgi:hypothetical protein
MQRKAYIQLTEAGEHVPTDIPGDHQRVSYLLDLMKMDNPKMLAGTAAIEQDETGKQVHIENLVTFLLPFDPVVANNAKAKGLGVNFLAATADKAASGVTVGNTGVELHWHDPQKFRKMTKDQKAEFSEWNKTQPKKNGSSSKRKRSNK